MRFCGIDASTSSTGFAILDDGKLVFQTTISLKNIKDQQTRINQMMVSLGHLIKEYNPDCLFVEDSWKASTEVTKLLSYIIGAIMYICIATNTGFNKLRPSSWRKAAGVEQGKKKREELKKEAIERVKKEFNIDVGDDAAEAILIAKAAFILTDEGRIFEED